MLAALPDRNPITAGLEAVTDGKLTVRSWPMNVPVLAEDEQLARLRADHPGHRIWRSVRFDGLLGDWVATLHDPAAGVDPTVIRSSAEELREALRAEGIRAARKAVGR
jgi:hypothetical protein